MDTHLRSVVKGISWRVLATMVTTIVVYLYSGELMAAAIVGSFDALAKIVLVLGSRTNLATYYVGPYPAYSLLAVGRVSRA